MHTVHTAFTRYRVSLKLHQIELHIRNNGKQDVLYRRNAWLLSLVTQAVSLTTKHTHTHTLGTKTNITASQTF